MLTYVAFCASYSKSALPSIDFIVEPVFTRWLFQHSFNQKKNPKIKQFTVGKQVLKKNKYKKSATWKWYDQ